MSDNNRRLPWNPGTGIVNVPQTNNASEMVPFALALREHEKSQLIQAFQTGYYEMGTEFLWRRSMSRLKLTISALGMKFVGEMLDRKDIDEFANPENVLTDYDAIRLSEILGVINSTGALRLKQTFELLSHLSKKEAEQSDERLLPSDATSTVYNCVKYILAEENFSIPIDFSNLRNRLSSETLLHEDPQVQLLFNSPPFFQRTTLRILIASVRTEKGAKLEHTLSNLNLFIPNIWPNIPEQDRWSVGTLYTDLSSLGNSPAVSSIKKALLKVKGFDYVHENIRSSTFKKAAQAVLAAHFSYNNFYLEGEPTKQLANLGTTIPSPAFADCMQAYLCIYLGNRYGVAWGAAGIAGEELRRISKDRWEYYLEKVLPYDDHVLYELQNERPASRFIELSLLLGFKDLSLSVPFAKRITAVDNANRVQEITSAAASVYKKMREN